MPSAAPYLLKEHREEKKGGKILVPVRFSWSRPRERSHRESARTVASSLHTVGAIDVDSLSEICAKGRLFHFRGRINKASGLFTYSPESVENRCPARGITSDFSLLIPRVHSNELPVCRPFSSQT